MFTPAAGLLELPAGHGCGVMQTRTSDMAARTHAPARQVSALDRGRARARHASSPPTVAGHRCARHYAATKAAAAAGVLCSQLGSVRSDLLWASRAGVSVANTSSRLRRCGRSFGGRAGTHRFEHDRGTLRACNPWKICASNAERTHRVGLSRGARGGDAASSPEDQRCSAPSVKVELGLLEAV